MDAPKDDIQDRLSCIEKELLHAAVEGASGLTGFENRFLDLLGDVEFAVRTEAVSKETLTLANFTTSRVEVLLECLLDFHTSADTWGQGLEQIFASIDINDITDETAPQPAPNPPRRASTSQPTLAPSSCPQYIEPAYRWLLANLHNPYPSVEIKDAIALKTSSYRKVIDAWFVDARKRIGWNMLRRERFSNKRIDIVDAATGFFLQEGPKRQLDPNVELAFVAVEKRAKDLYSDKFSESALASKLDAALLDLTPEMKVYAQASERWKKEQEKSAKGQAEQDVQAASYPSPSHSGSTTPKGPAPSPSSEEDEISSNTVIGSKRRNALSESSGDPDPRPNKRSRVESPSHIAATSLPSPALSFDESLQAMDNNQSGPSAPIMLDVLPISSTSRKRRLSDADGQGVPKRPRNIHIGPRVHAVSDPLPVTSTLSSWFESHFGIPSGVTVEEPEPSLPLEVELYDYSTFNSMVQPNSLETQSSPSDTSNHIPSPYLQDVATFLATPPVISETPSYALDISTNEFNYDELYWEPEDLVTDFAGRNLAHQDSSVLSFDLSSDLHFSSDFFDSFTTPCNTALMTEIAVVADTSTPISCNPASNIDWVLSPMLLSQHTFTSVPKLDLNILPEDHNSTFDPSIMRAATLDNTISQMLAQADKAAKQRRLVEMKEATRRLEMEIAAS